MEILLSVLIDQPCTAASGIENIQNNEEIQSVNAATQITNLDESNDSKEEETSFNIQKIYRYSQY